MSDSSGLSQRITVVSYSGPSSVNVGPCTGRRCGPPLRCIYSLSMHAERSPVGHRLGTWSCPLASWTPTFNFYQSAVCINCRSSAGRRSLFHTYHTSSLCRGSSGVCAMKCQSIAQQFHRNQKLGFDSSRADGRGLEHTLRRCRPACKLVPVCRAVLPPRTHPPGLRAVPQSGFLV